MHLVIYGLLAFVWWRPLWRLSGAWSDAAAPLRSRPVLRVLAGALDRMWRGPGWGRALLFASLNHLVFWMLFLPVSLYANYFHERRFGLSAYTPGSYAWDEAKELLLVIGVTCLLTLGLFGLARRFRRWWLALGLVCAAGLLLSSAIDPYRGRLYHDQTPLPDGPLRAQLLGLLGRAHVEVADIVVEHSSRTTRTVDAYFAGEGPTRSVVLGDTLVQTLSEGEILAAVAHEAGHVLEPKWPARFAAATACLAFLLLVHFLFRQGARQHWLGVSDYGDVRLLPLVSLVFYAATVLAAPLSGAASRARELEADQAAVRLTGDPAAVRSMLIHAARVNLLDPDPPRWVVWRGMGHPPLVERLAAIAER